jgi:hypothetical protein
MQEIKNFLPADAIIIPGHFGPIKKNEIDFGINYLLQLESEVREAKAKNLALDEMLKQVKMNEYNRGYKIFEFVHYKINIPAVFNEANK